MLGDLKTGNPPSRFVFGEFAIAYDLTPSLICNPDEDWGGWQEHLGIQVSCDKE
jgi:hypothetical protein